MVERQFSNELCAAWGKADALYSRWAEQNHINYFTLLALWLLYNTKGRLTQKKISQYYGWPKQTTNSVIRSLNQKGLLELLPSDTDRREKKITLTEIGRSYTEALLRPLFALEARVYDSMREERLLEMLHTLKLFITLFEAELERGNE